MKEENMNQNESSELNNDRYPSIVKRVKAAIIDGLVLVLCMYAATDVFAWFENVPEIARICTFVFIFVLYDPICVSLVGRTIGHQLAGISVKRENDESKNITFPLAIIRFLIKVFLGWFSFMTMHSNYKKMTMHDMAVKSVVINDN